MPWTCYSLYAADWTNATMRTVPCSFDAASEPITQGSILVNMLHGNRTAINQKYIANKLAAPSFSTHWTLFPKLDVMSKAIQPARAGSIKSALPG